MRIAKTSEQITEWMKHQKNPSKKTWFVQIDKHPESEWVSYSLTHLGADFAFEQRERYEWFCVGFLVFYDDVVRNATVDHTISFRWSAHTVTIYLDPVAERRENSPNYSKYPNWKEQDPEKLIPAWKGQDPSMLVSSYGDTSDPPPPPPPPPPPMD